MIDPKNRIEPPDLNNLFFSLLSDKKFAYIIGKVDKIQIDVQQQNKKLNEQNSKSSNTAPKKLPHEDPKDWRVVNKPILDLCKNIEKELKILQNEQKISFNQIEENLQNLPKMTEENNLAEILPNSTKDQNSTNADRDAKIDNILDR